jgi:hypothetical protein
MKTFIFLTIFSINVYGQAFECDNNFGDCGTPEQSGGGGNSGGGSILISNTDLGDTYQHADDYDDDGIEDSSDNCVRTKNPNQVDIDADGVGNICDNCLNVWNKYQEDYDADGIGDNCDDDIDNDSILNNNDQCPYQWGNDTCFEFETNSNVNHANLVDIRNRINHIYIQNQADEKRDIQNQSCSSFNISNTNIIPFLIMIFTFFNVIRRKN